VSTAGASYHLWLKPSGAPYDVLAEAIRELARELAAPVFEPHVTLLGHLEGREDDHRRRTELLARELSPFPIVLTDAAYGDVYFQCLFLRVQQSSAVMDAYARACLAFDRPHGAYMPHLSLAYGVYPDARKRAIMAGLPPALRTSFAASAVYLIKAASEDPKDWHEVLDVSFGTP
jgi:2'-5' RNA ligase